ncbi:MAG: hypothetical protein R2912_02180 [Eubacteriales bacterium]
MSARCYEPDAPNYTPRTWDHAAYGRIHTWHREKMADADDCRRKYWSFDTKEGVAHMIHTYQRRRPAAAV